MDKGASPWWSSARPAAPRSEFTLTLGTAKNMENLRAHDAFLGGAPNVKDVLEGQHVEHAESGVALQHLLGPRCRCPSPRWILATNTVVRLSSVPSSMMPRSALPYLDHKGQGGGVAGRLYQLSALTPIFAQTSLPMITQCDSLHH